MGQYQTCLLCEQAGCQLIEEERLASSELFNGGIKNSSTKGKGELIMRWSLDKDCRKITLVWLTQSNTCEM